MVNVTMLVANRPELTKQALESIGDLSNATVAIRDAGMNGEVHRVVREWGVDKQMAYAISPNPLGTGPARNSVIDLSERLFTRGDYLYLSDDDVYWTQPDWLEVLTTAYDEAWDHGFRAIGCYNHPFNRPCAPPIPLKCGVNICEVWALATQSMLMSWSVWDDFGPFCETPVGKVCQSEDVDFGNRIRNAGFKLGIVAPALLANCGITNSFGEKIVGWEMVYDQRPKGVIVK